MIQLPPGEASQLHTLNLTMMERDILRQMQLSPETYVYESLAVLEFELTTRSRITEAAIDLNNSGATFATFEGSYCNERYWQLQPSGAFRLRSGVTPAEGITDIFRNGRLYAFECATAMVIVLYKAVLGAIGEASFNTYFGGLVLYDWQYDSDLRIISRTTGTSYPGDVRYFNNPDFNPTNPEWRGENAIQLPGGVYFAHGLGIRRPEEILRILNMRRRPGSLTPAHLLEQYEALDYAYTYRLKSGVARIGGQVFVLG